MKQSERPLLGAHMSIAGGYYRAIERAKQAGCDCVQLFTKNNNQWRAKPIEAADCEAFQEQLEKTGITYPLSHSSYLLNLASPQDELRRRSIDGLVTELQRAGQLGIFAVVLHPGAAMGSTEAVAIRRIAQGVNEAIRRTRDSHTICLLETTAGQGTCIGSRFDHLARILDRVRDTERVGVCLDTCHIFAAGYDLRTPEAYERTMAEFDRLIGIRRIRALHLNDSKRELGSQVDRHAHIGEGQLGREAFRCVLRDRRWRGIPMYLETPKGEIRGRDLDRINLQRLRRLSRT